MKVTGKCDVYSFGVVTLEIIIGHYPGELIGSPSSFSSSSSSSSTTISLSEFNANSNMQLKDLFDKRLEIPESELADELVTITKLAFSCINSNPKLRPTMQQVSQEFSTRRLHVPQALHTVALKEVLDFDIQVEED